MDSSLIGVWKRIQVYAYDTIFVLNKFFRLNATASFLPQELLPEDLNYPVKMNFGVGELVLVQFVMEHHHFLKGKFLLS